MKKDASRFSPKGVLFHRTFFTAPNYTNRQHFCFVLKYIISSLNLSGVDDRSPARHWMQRYSDASRQMSLR